MAIQKVQTSPIKETSSSSFAKMMTIGLSLVVAYQFNTIQSLSYDIKILKSKLPAIHNQVTSLQSLNQTLTQNVIKSVKKDKPTIKFQELPYYATRIPTMEDDPTVPLDKQHLYTYDDFERVFGVTPLHTVVTHPVVAQLFKHHDILTEEDYLDDKIKQDAITATHKWFLEKGSNEAFEREHLAVKWASSETGFGLFATKDIPLGTILGRYTGVINLDIDNTDYVWELVTEKVTTPDGVYPVDLGVDARKAGNYMRFANHVGDSSNSRPLFIIYQNRRHVLYVAEKDIKAGQEITTDYGSGYFSTRKENYVEPEEINIELH